MRYLIVLMSLVRASIDITLTNNLVQELKTMFVPVILDKIAEIHLPSIAIVDKRLFNLTLTSTDIKVAHSSDPSSIIVALDQSINGLNLKVSGLNMSATSYFYNKAGPLKYNGKLKATITSIDLEMNITLGY
jgi:hypothetical protein